jgi:homocitrate synthase NifV
LRFLQQFTKAAAAAGVDRVRLADTVGIFDPIQTYDLFAELCSMFPAVHFGFHGHNDLGMGTANALAAIRGGASSVDVTVNGLGERAGNAVLAEVVMASRIAMQAHDRLDTTRFAALSELVSAAVNRPLPADKPIVGRNAFLHESGIHVHGQLRNPNSYEPFAAREVGRDRLDFVIGKHTGTAAIENALRSQGMEINARDARQLLNLVRQTVKSIGRPLQLEELVRLYVGKGQRVAEAAP